MGALDENIKYHRVSIAGTVLQVTGVFALEMTGTDSESSGRVEQYQGCKDF